MFLYSIFNNKYVNQCEHFQQQNSCGLFLKAQQDVMLSENDYRLANQPFLINNLTYLQSRAWDLMKLKLLWDTIEVWRQKWNFVIFEHVMWFYQWIELVNESRDYRKIKVTSEIFGLKKALFGCMNILFKRSLWFIQNAYHVW